MFTSSNIRNPDMGPIGPLTYSFGRRPDPPPCSCPECTQQYRSTASQHTWVHIYNSGINNEQAASICRELVQNINANTAFLQQHLASHGLGIAQRWKKKSVKNREALLKSVDPDMYDRKWHEGHIAYETRHDCWLKESRKHQNLFLLPYMSLENLKEVPSRLIRLLQLRATCCPADLAVADSRRIQFGWTTGILETTFNGCAISMHGPRYGTLVPWVAAEIHRGDRIGFPRGHLILKAQDHLLSTLRGAVEVLLDGLPQDLEMAPTTGASPFSSILPDSTVHTDEAFSNSTSFDLEKLAHISEAQLKSAADHVFLLQTDVGYIRRCVQRYLESGISKLPPKVIFLMIIQDLDYEVWAARHWTWISEEVSELQKIRIRFADQINQGQTMPPKYSKRLSSLESMIVRLLDIQSRHIQCTFPYRPGFQNQYNFTHSISGGIAFTSHSSKLRSDDIPQQHVNNAEEFVKDPLHWCIVSLTTDPDAPGTWDKFRLLEFLDQFLSNATVSERGRMDEMLLRKISDLAAFNEVLALVRSHRPRAVQQDMSQESTEEQGRGWRFMSKTTANTELDNNGQTVFNMRSVQELPLTYPILGPLLKAFMDLEMPGDSDPKWRIKTAMQTRSLRVFWDEYRYQHQARLKKAGISRLDILDDMRMIRCESSVEDSEYQKNGIRESLDLSASSASNKETKSRRQQAVGKKTSLQDDQLRGIVEPFKGPSSKPERPKSIKRMDTDTEIQTEWGSTPAEPKPTAPTKNKPKTRGEASTDPAPAMEGLTISPENHPQPEKLLIKKPTFEVFRTLFGEKRSASIAWDKFVDAMAHVGFISRRSGGSAVTFDPVEGSKWCGQGAIVFHRPHPDSTIDPVMLRSIGKRMRKWFGWGSETFGVGK